MQTIYIDISNKSILPTIYAKQGDVGRKFKAVVLENSVSREITVNEHFSAGYDGASGSGNYETIGERSAFEVYGNVVTVELAPNMLQAPGLSNFCLTMNSGDGNVIGLWNIIVDVEETPGFLGDPIKEYYPGISAVLYVDQNLSKEQKEKARANIGSGTGNVKTVNGIAPDENGNVEVTVSGQNASLTTEQINALDGMFKVCAFIKDDVSSEYNAFKTAFGITDSGGEEEPDTPVEPDDPDTPEVTLTSISATYSGGDVAVGTAVTALTGIVVTAHYSDGTSEAVTGYSLSGTIAEGSNTVTVTYGGKTTTFAVTGVAESGGGDSGEDMEGYETVNILDVVTAKEGYCFKGTSGTGTHWNKELYTLADVKTGDVLWLTNGHNEGLNTAEYFGALNTDGTFVNLSSEITDEDNHNFTYKTCKWTATKDYPEVYWSPVKGSVAKAIAEYDAPQPTWTRKKVE